VIPSTHRPPPTGGSSTGWSPTTSSKALGKRGFYAQVDLGQGKAYDYAIELMASAAMIDDAQEGFSAFLEKRHPTFTQQP
jgi:1,4-dihydroxy-2-naphthoyl-CoA synthase